jgi:hypothetical protein
MAGIALSSMRQQGLALGNHGAHVKRAQQQQVLRSTGELIQRHLQGTSAPPGHLVTKKQGTQLPNQTRGAHAHAELGRAAQAQGALHRALQRAQRSRILANVTRGTKKRVH